MQPQLSLFQQCSIQSQDLMQTWLHWRHQDALLVQKHFVALFHPKPNECLRFDLESCNYIHCCYPPMHVTFHRSLRLAPWCFASTLVIYENPPFNSLVWGSLRLAPINKEIDNFSFYPQVWGSLTLAPIICIYTRWMQCIVGQAWASCSVRFHRKCLGKRLEHQIHVRHTGVCGVI